VHVTHVGPAPVHLIGRTIDHRVSSLSFLMRPPRRGGLTRTGRGGNVRDGWTTGRTVVGRVVIPLLFSGLLLAPIIILQRLINAPCVGHRDDESQARGSRG